MLVPLVALVTGCRLSTFPPPEGRTVEPVVTAPAPWLDADAAAIQHAVLAESNAARSARGLEPLTDDPRLTVAATGHAAELARRGVLSHTSEQRGRETLDKRLFAAGARDWTLAGENLARLTDPADRVAVETIRLWLSSPNHRQNLLAEEYRRSGVGAVRASAYWYVVHVYTAPR